MSKLLLKDDGKYIIRECDDEDELEKMVIEHYKEIFGEQVMFFKKQKLQTKAGIKARTDGFIISLDEKRWYILEVELSRHNLYDHIVPQITKFKQAHNSYETRKKIREVFYDDINDSLEKKMKVRLSGIKELYKFLTELIDSEPIVVIIIDKKTKELEEVSESLPFESRVIEWETFVKEGIDLSDHIHLFESFAKPETPKLTRRKPGEITPRREYRIPILEILIEMGGKGKMNKILEKIKGEIKDKLTSADLERLPSGTSIRWKNAAQWERQKMREEGLLKTDSPRGVWEITKKGENYYYNFIRLRKNEEIKREKVVRGAKRRKEQLTRSGWQRLKELYPTVEVVEKKIKEAKERGCSQSYIKVLENLKKYWKRQD